MERIQKLIANSGYCSRRKAEELIEKGKVKLNGNIIREMGVLASNSDIIEVEGKVITKDDQKVYILLNKPRGVLTTTKDDKERTTVIDVINIAKRVYPVGRLDYDTTGLLLLTNDGDLTNLLLHPSNNIEKMYVAKISGIISGTEMRQLENGVVIDGIKTARANLKLRKIDKNKKTSIVEITIHEGRNHQVKKMFEKVGYEVLKLKRERVAFLDLKGLKSGEYRYLTVKEVKKLYSLND